MFEENNQTQNPKKLFVGNLPFSITQSDLENLFAPFGEIAEANLIVDRMSNRSKGFGFVEFKEEEAAQNAIKEMHEKDVDGRNIIVNVARPMKPRNERRGGFDRNRKPYNRDNRQW